MKSFGGILGIIGGLLGLFVFFLYLTRGFGLGALPATGGADALQGVLGSIAAFSCIGLGIAILMGAGRLSGIFLLMAALLGIFVGSEWLMTPALIGAGLAIVHGGRKLSPEERRQQLELEVQQRYGAGR
jgi:hypothetical protein